MPKASVCRPTSQSMRRSRRKLWRPLQIDADQARRGSHGFYAAAILAPGQTAATATEELRAITTRLTEAGRVSRGDAVHRVCRAARRGDSRRGAPGDVAADGRRGLPAADRLRERRQPAAGARRCAAARDGGAHGDWRGAESSDAPAVHRESRAGGRGRGRSVSRSPPARCEC